MSYYRAALGAARDGNLTLAMNYAALAKWFEPDNKDADKLFMLCHHRLYGSQEATSTLLPDIQAQANVRKFKKAYTISELLPDCALKYNILGCLLALRRRYRGASKMFAAALEYDKGNQLATKAIAAVAVKRSLL